MNKHFLEKTQICQGFLPVSMDGAANAGDWISMKNYGRVAVVLYKAIGTAGDDPVITLEQATDVAGTGAKALTFTRIDRKQAASNLLAVAEFTTITQAAANTYTNDTLAEQAAIVVLDVLAEELDVDNGFDCIRASVADVGTNAQLGCALYFPHEPRYSKSPLLTAIAD